MKRPAFSRLVRRYLVVLAGCALMFLGSALWMAPLQAALLTCFWYGFSAVQKSLITALGAGGKYGFTSLLFRSLWAFLLVVIFALMAFQVIFLAGVVIGAKRILQELREDGGPPAPTKSIDLWGP